MHNPLDDFDDNDPALLQEAVGDVRRIHAEARAVRPKPAPRARQFEADEREALEDSRQRPFASLDPSTSSSYRRDDVPARTLKRLSRGLFAVQDEFDLHTLTAEQALPALRQFLAECHEAGEHCVRVIHGKGLRSPLGESVLRPLVEHHLRQRRDILAFSSAPSNQGGTGALLILLAQ